MAKSEGYVSAEYLKKAADITRQIKQRSYELMQISAGDTVLDLGCGPGMDTIPLANIVGDRGRVVGVDLDADMLKEADRYAIQAGVGHIATHQQSSVSALPYADHTFDACRMERLLQVLPATVPMSLVLAEAVRVLKPGAAIVAVDTDWGSVSVDAEDSVLERTLMTFFAEHMRPNGFAGRQLYRHFKEQGLSQVEAEVFALQHREFAQTPFGDWLCDAALAQQRITLSQAQAWKSQLQRATEQGLFWSSVNMVVVSAIKD